MDVVRQQDAIMLRRIGQHQGIGQMKKADFSGSEQIYPWFLAASLSDDLYTEILVCQESDRPIVNVYTSKLRK